MEKTLLKSEIVLAEHYIYKLSNEIMRLNLQYNQDMSNRRVKYWIKDKYLITYNFSSYKWRFLSIYEFDTELEIKVEEKTDTVDPSDLFDQLLEKIDNDEWVKDE